MAAWARRATATVPHHPKSGKDSRPGPAQPQHNQPPTRRTRNWTGPCRTPPRAAGRRSAVASGACLEPASSPPHYPSFPPTALGFSPRGPTPSLESLAGGDSCGSSRGAGALFSVLSAELRRQVLIATFGGRTLHLDLRLSHPPPAARIPWQHGAGRAPLDYDMRRGSSNDPKTWHWWGSVCHRSAPVNFALESTSRAWTKRNGAYPWHDDCIRGFGQRTLCESWAPTGSSDWDGYCDSSIGAMGWLLACRQTYVEGIDVLYATNTFFIESRALLDQLFCPVPRTRHLILPHRLASITSLELNWNLLLGSDWVSQYGPIKDRETLETHLRHLPDVFPNLRRLLLSFGRQTYCDEPPPNTVIPELERVLFRPIADLVLRLPQLQRHVAVEIPRSVFADIFAMGHPTVFPFQPDSTELGLGFDDWWRYPIVPSPSLSPGDNVEDRDTSDRDFGRYYLIKSGGPCSFFWDSQGKRMVQKFGPVA